MTIEKKLDAEWIDLITHAKQIGLKKDEIRNFLEQASTLKKTHPNIKNHP